MQVTEIGCLLRENNIFACGEERAILSPLSSKVRSYVTESHPSLSSACQICSGLRTRHNEKGGYRCPRTIIHCGEAVTSPAVSPMFINEYDSFPEGQPLFPQYIRHPAAECSPLPMFRWELNIQPGQDTSN